MPSNVTPLRPGQSEEPILQPSPTNQLQPVTWLAGVLGLTESQTYYQIREGHVPEACIVKLGRRRLVNPQKVYAWLELAPAESTLPETITTAGCESGHDQTNDCRKSG